MSTEVEPIHLSARAAELALRRPPRQPEPRRLSLAEITGYDEPELVAIEAEFGHDAARQSLWSQCIPERFVRAKLAAVEPSSVPALAEWAAAPGGRNLVVLGPIGVGKTYAAVAACREAFFARVTELRFFAAVMMLDMLRPGGPDDAMENLCQMEMLMLDDIGTERTTEWAAERLYAIINERWLHCRPTITTSNLEPRELEEHLGGRVYGRLVGEGAVVVRLVGKDRRLGR